MKYLTLLAFCLSICTQANAQLEKILHQTFEITDDIVSIDLDLMGEYKIQQWAGNTILIETKIQIWDASPAILNFFVEQGRYEILEEGSETSLGLVSKDKVRRPMKYKDSQCYEIVELRLMVPDNFVTSDQYQLVRQNPDGTPMVVKKAVEEVDGEDGENTVVNPEGNEEIDEEGIEN